MNEEGMNEWEGRGGVDWRGVGWVKFHQDTYYNFSLNRYQ